MRKLILLLLVTISLNSTSQVVNRFRDSTWFAKGVQFDSTLNFKNLKVAGTNDTFVSVLRANGNLYKVGKSTFVKDLATKTALNDSITTVRNIRNVDTIYKVTDSIVYSINGVRYSVIDNSGGGAYIPLSGTVANDSVTGGIQMTNGYSIYTNDDFYEKFISFSDADDAIRLFTLDKGTGFGSDYIQNKTSANIQSNNPYFRGFTGSEDYTANITDLDYVQKKYVDSIAGGGGSDSLIYNRTYLDLVNNVNGSELIKGAKYKITDRGDRGLFFTALSENQLDNYGHRLMLCPAVYGVGTFLGHDWIGVWHITKSANVDDLTVWGGLVWKNLTGAIGTATDDFTLDATNWVLVPKTSFTNEYTELEFEVAYDFNTDWITKQYDKYDNIVGYGVDALGYQPCDVTDWNEIGSLLAGYGGCGVYANHKAVLGIFNNTQQAPSIISGNSCSKISGDNCGSISGNTTPTITDNNNTGTISFNTSTAITGLTNTVGDVVSNNTSADAIDGTVAPFDTWTGDIENLTVKTNTATDNSVSKIVGVNANGETKMVDKSTFGVETIVELGTITYTDINSASATQDISIPLATNDFPDSSYCVGIIYKFTELFDGGSDAFGIIEGFNGRIYTVSPASAYVNYISEGVVADILFTTTVTQQLKMGAVTVNLPLRFDVSNPQDFTAGSVTIYAITKPFPF